MIEALPFTDGEFDTEFVIWHRAHPDYPARSSRHQRRRGDAGDPRVEIGIAIRIDRRAADRAVSSAVQQPRLQSPHRGRRIGRQQLRQSHPQRRAFRSTQRQQRIEHRPARAAAVSVRRAASTRKQPRFQRRPNVENRVADAGRERGAGHSPLVQAGPPRVAGLNSFRTADPAPRRGRPRRRIRGSSPPRDPRIARPPPGAEILAQVTGKSFSASLSRRHRSRLAVAGTSSRIPWAAAPGRFRT